MVWRTWRKANKVFLLEIYISTNKKAEEDENGRVNCRKTNSEHRN